MNFRIFPEKPTFIPDPNDVNENKYLCILGYIGILFVIPLIMRPNSPYVKYHANQGLLLFIFEILVGFVSGIFSVIFGIIFLGFVASIISSVLSLACLGLMIYGIVSTGSGYIRPLPFIGDAFVGIRYS